MCISEFLVESDDFVSSFSAQWNPFLAQEEAANGADALQLAPTQRIAPSRAPAVTISAPMAHAA